MVTGHGKYEKVDDSSSEATNCGSGKNPQTLYWSVAIGVDIGTV